MQNKYKKILSKMAAIISIISVFSLVFIDQFSYAGQTSQEQSNAADGDISLVNDQELEDFLNNNEAEGVQAGPESNSYKVITLDQVNNAQAISPEMYDKVDRAYKSQQALRRALAEKKTNPYSDYGSKISSAHAEHKAAYNEHRDAYKTHVSKTTVASSDKSGNSMINNRELYRAAGNLEKLQRELKIQTSFYNAYKNIKSMSKDAQTANNNINDLNKKIAAAKEQYFNLKHKDTHIPAAVVNSAATPTVSPSINPTALPSAIPPSVAPTVAPSPIPSPMPTVEPSATPMPSTEPTVEPSAGSSNTGSTGGSTGGGTDGASSDTGGDSAGSAGGSEQGKDENTGGTGGAGAGDGDQGQDENTGSTGGGSEQKESAGGDKSGAGSNNSQNTTGSNGSDNKAKDNNEGNTDYGRQNQNFNRKTKTPTAIINGPSGSTYGSAIKQSTAGANNTISSTDPIITNQDAIKKGSKTNSSDIASSAKEIGVAQPISLRLRNLLLSNDALSK